MWISQLRDQTWELVRWRVQHDAWHSDCSATVLFGAAKKVRDGAAALGYSVSAPAQDRDAHYYKVYIRDRTTETLGALSHYHFRECTLSTSKNQFEDAARRIKDCLKAVSEIAGDEPYFVPADD